MLCLTCAASLGAYLAASQLSRGNRRASRERSPQIEPERRAVPSSYEFDGLSIAMYVVRYRDRCSTVYSFTALSCITVPHLEIVTDTHDTTFVGVFVLPFGPPVLARERREE